MIVDLLIPPFVGRDSQGAVAAWNYSSPCTFGMSWVGAIWGAGLGGAAPVVTGGGVCASADFGGGAIDRCEGSGAAAGFAASGLAFGTGTVRLATRGMVRGGRGSPLTLAVGGAPGAP